MIIGHSAPGKTNALLDLTIHQPDIAKIYLYVKDPYEEKNQVSIKKPEVVGLKHCNDRKAFIECSIDIDDVYENIEEYNPNKECKICLKCNITCTELLNRDKKVNVFVVFITQSYFAVPKNIRLISTHLFGMKILNKREPAANCT